nr:type VI secretion system amidase effector protein Tae4 [Rhodopirellula sp. SM50]
MKAKCVNKQNASSSPFGNYCAINLSECFIKSGIAMQSANGAKCWSHKGPKHLLRAEDFAKWLKRSAPPGFGKTEKIAPADFQSVLDGRTGVIFFKDYWTRGNESDANRSGDHIDLWNEDAITSSSMFWRAVSEFFGAVSDLNKSKEILFWEVK